MRALVQRVTRAAVRVDGEVVGRIDRPGLLVLVGVTSGDGVEQVQRTGRKLAGLRLLRPADGNGLSAAVSADEAGAPLLVVSQFTLYADTSKGRRPSWSAAAPAALAEPLVQALVEDLRGRGLCVATGVFGADMAVELVNDGPVTVLVEV